MIGVSILTLVLLMICVGEFSIQVVISDLSQWLKEKTALSQPYTLSKLSSFKFWISLLGVWFWVLFPLVLVLVILANTHRFISNLVACPWCIAFYLAFLVNFFYLKTDVITAILLAPLALVFVTILDKIHSW